jgi:hypothetical protein
VADEAWAHRWNAEHLLAGLDELLTRPGVLDERMRAVPALTWMFVERGYRERFPARDEAPDALLTFDRSGHSREAAVRRLSRVDDPFALPFLLLRLDDPVDAVREVAGDGVRRWLTTDHGRHLVPLQPMTERLTRRRRSKGVAEEIRAWLLDDPLSRDAIRSSARTAADPLIRSSCARLLATADPGPPGLKVHNGQSPARVRQAGADEVHRPGWTAPDS